MHQYKRFLKIIIMFCFLLFSTLTVNASPLEFAGGSGTESDPYLVETKEQLNNVRNNLDAHYKMIADIEFTDEDFEEGGAFYNAGQGWSPIGTADAPFTGKYDGNNYKIVNLSINATTEVVSSAGLFGYNNGTISNLGILNGKLVITENAENNAYIGAVAGINGENGVIKGCYTTCYVKGLSGGTYPVITGGIAGENYGNISQCYNSGEVFAHRDCGGITGYNQPNAVIDNCFNTGMVWAAEGGINGVTGGIASVNYAQATISQCYNIGTVYVQVYNRCGAIAGTNYSEKIFDCYYLSGGRSAIGGDDNTFEIGTKECSLDEMKSVDTFESFDFENVWAIDENGDYPLPVLKLCHFEYSGESTDDFAGGSGTVFDPYIIETKEQLDCVRNYLQSSFKLENDIIFSVEDFAAGRAFYNDGQGWKPIGADSVTPFTGTFDGNGRTIKGLYINIESSSGVSAGLFGFSAGVISNLKVEAASVSAVSTNSSVGAGGIAGTGRGGKISNCEVDGTIHTYATADYKSAYTGGIIGSGDALIEDCVNNASLSSKARYYNGTHVGGISGSNSGTIRNCQNKGAISSADNSGGIAGANSGTIAECVNLAYCKAADLYNGGIVGKNTGTVTKCYNSAEVSSGSQYCGGIVGYNDSETALVELCYNLGMINGNTNTGGIVGYNAQKATVTKCYNGGVVSGDENVGGISGGGYSGIINNCFNIGSVKGYEYIGGISGENRGSISNCYSTGTIEATASSYPYAGGVIGKGNESVNSYYLDTALAGSYSGADAAIALTEEEMILSDSFAGFDFESVWTMEGNKDYPYPEIKGLEVHVHTYSQVINPATFSENGSKYLLCEECGSKKDVSTIYSIASVKLSVTSYTYNGKVRKPSVVVKDSEGIQLVLDKDYTVVYPTGRKNVGTYTVSVVMQGKYSGSKKLTFKIKPVSVSKCTVKLSTSVYTYNGKVKIPSVTVKNADGTKLTKNTHYTVKYGNGRKNVGKYKVTVSMKGNYSGTKTLYFTINPQKTTVSKLTPGKKSIKVSITKKSAQVTGYQVQYSTSKKFTNTKTKTISGYKNNSCSLKNLSSKKTYYVRVRTYKNVSGVKYYSGWSAYKYAKTK